MSWGVSVPGDDAHVMYVWFDALTSYISTLGWPDESYVKKGGEFERFWANGTPTQYCGKDNLRQQTAIWQAMLMAAELPQTYQVVIDGFITGEGGVKMSKSLGNVIDPLDIVREYGTDALRYYMVRSVSSFEDSPFTAEKFKDTYNAELANGLGNLVSRVVKMAETNSVSISHNLETIIPEQSLTDAYNTFISKFEINKACDLIWEKISAADKFVQENQPFKTIKTDQKKGSEQIEYLLREIAMIARLLVPILPGTSAKISEALLKNKVETALFLRK